MASETEGLVLHDGDAPSLRATGEAEPEPAFVPCEFYMTWTKTGRLPRFTSPSQYHAKLEARRLARRNPGRTFIVMRGVEKVRYGEDLDGEPQEHPDKATIESLVEALAEVLAEMEHGVSLPQTRERAIAAISKARA